MKTIGLIGGTSWESTIPYYQIINEAVRDKMGGLHSAKIILNSVEFADVEKHMSAGEWDEVAEIIGGAAKSLERAGADFIAICSNTLHKVIPLVDVSIPFVHIADATVAAVKADGIDRIALLGTKYTMTQEFYVNRVKANGVDVLIPDAADVNIVDEVIFKELCVGVISEKSKHEYIRIMNDLAAKGAQAVVFGCTEIGLLVGAEDTALPVYDTTVIHSKRLAQLAME